MSAKTDWTGAIIQATTPTTPAGGGARAGGPAKGVVLVTYTPDDEQNRSGSGIECDVMLYGSRSLILTRVPVAAGGGYANGQWWVPAATTRNLKTGDAISWTAETIGTAVITANPLDFDGEHVLVAFIDGDVTQPIVTAPLPHPRAARRPARGEPAEVGSLHPAELVGVVRALLHCGARLLTDEAGSVVIDTREAPRTTGGGEADVAGGGRVIVQVGATSRLEIWCGETLLLVVEDGVVKLGASPTMHGMLFEAFKTIWDAHTLPTAFGPSGTPTPLPTSCKSPGVLLDAP